MRFKHVFDAEFRTLAFLTRLEKINMIPKERKYPMINGEPLATTNDIQAKIIMKNCHLFRAQILSDITGISEDKFINNEFIDTNIPISLKHYCASDLAFKISDKQIVTARVYTCYTRNNNVKDFLYQANYQNNICARLRSQGKSIGNANVTQIVFYHKCPNIGNFFIQKQGYHNKKLYNHSSEMITRYTINLDNIDNVLHTKSVNERLILNLKFLLSDAETKLEFHFLVVTSQVSHFIDKVTVILHGLKLRQSLPYSNLFCFYCFLYGFII